MKKGNSMFKKTCSLLAISVLTFSLSVPTFAAKDNSPELKGTWSRGEVTQDPIATFKGYKTDEAGNKTVLDVSPFTGNNIISSATAKGMKGANGEVGTYNYWDGVYYYEYIPNSYVMDYGFKDDYHYNVGHTQAYNGTGGTAKLSYSQASAVTSQWSVTAQVSSTAEIKANYLQKLGLTFGGSYTSSNTTTSTSTILYQIDVSPGKTGYIDAALPGAYSNGTASYKEYLYFSATGTFTSTGNTVTNSNEGGWSPLANSSTSVLNFTSGEY
ncbi:hypothetical protein [Paenibacillus sp. UNC451MF]|uniref:hypothetical protein n=1 Tax=Paenibacillus sp. UNC451MF TaxID=1449063 RepID=UPI0004921049|nr:hypothetical protein [Paenibacillus sp. UNC451MF]